MDDLVLEMGGSGAWSPGARVRCHVSAPKVCWATPVCPRLGCREKMAHEAAVFALRRCPDSKEGPGPVRWVPGASSMPSTLPGTGQKVNTCAPLSFSWTYKPLAFWNTTDRL